MSYHIAFDISHKPRGKIDENLTELRDYLNSNDFMCYNFLEVPITEESLTPYDILVFVCPDFARVSSLEINAIVNWVKNSGGGLLLLSHAGGDRGRGSNLSEISEQFGIAFENDQVLDERLNLGLENIPLISSFNIPHPVTAGIGSLCYRSGSSLSIIGTGSFSIADSNETSEPFSCPLICVSEQEKGRTCCIGSYEMFRDQVGGGFQCNDNPQLALNIFKWLVSDYRIELRANAEIPTPITHTSSESPSLSIEQDDTISSLTSNKRMIEIDYTMKISNKSELVKLLKILQAQINTIKSTIDELVEKTIESDNETSNVEELEIPRSSDSIQDLTSIEQEESNFIEGVKESGKDIFDGLDDTTLTDLPPKPKTLEKSDSNSIDKLNPPPEFKDKDKSKNELKTEKKGLETKLSSVEDLMKFIDKKHSSGKLDDEEYAKRSKKLQRDLKKTKKRMNFIDKLLEK
ncbi:MAG: hypothetical protein ACFFC3_12805 [Candidatus Odinarchaeota archaeon]